ncbi:MAG: type II methionyl aminopeptidase [Candidatus Pacearchaeota archaeon]
MTEKQYGGKTGRESKKVIENRKEILVLSEGLKKVKMSTEEKKAITYEDFMSLKEAGKIAKEVANYAKSIIRPNVKLLEIAEKIEDKIMSLGGKPAFPVNLSINDIAAHYTPSWNDETLASGLLKIDMGVHVNGFIADTAFSIDLEGKEENKKLIELSENAVKKAIEVVKFGIPVGEVGKAIGEVITSKGFSPIRNLTGHEVKRYLLHSGLSIPNYNNGNTAKLSEGVYAIEPFVTNGQGIVYESKPSGIYIFKERKGVRDRLAREILDYIENEYLSLPFCSRWLIKKFSPKALFALAALKQAGCIEEFMQLVEKSKKPVAQAEHTFVVFKDKIEVTTR